MAETLHERPRWQPQAEESPAESSGAGGGDDLESDVDDIDHMNGECGAKCHIILFVYESLEHGTQTPFFCVFDRHLVFQDILRDELHQAYHESARRVVQAADEAQERVQIHVPEYYGPLTGHSPVEIPKWLPGMKYRIPGALNPFTKKPLDSWSQVMKFGPRFLFFSVDSHKMEYRLQLHIRTHLRQMLTGAKFAFYEPMSPGLYVPTLADLNMEGIIPPLSPLAPWNWLQFDKS